MAKEEVSRASVPHIENFIIDRRKRLKFYVEPVFPTISVCVFSSHPLDNKRD